MLTCIIVEDQPPAQRILQKYISDSKTLLLKNTFSDVIKAKSFLEKENVDLIFLDVHLPKVSGISFLKSNPNLPKVILTTAFSEYALESYEYKVQDYLLKPYSYERFLQAVSKAQEAVKIDSNNIFIKTGYDIIRINENDILYIKSDGDYTEVYTLSKLHLSSDALRQWLEKLPYCFCQIHKSFIINTNHIEKISGNRLFISNGDELPIGRAYKKKFTEDYLKMSS